MSEKVDMYMTQEAKDSLEAMSGEEKQRMAEQIEQRTEALKEDMYESFVVGPMPLPMTLRDWFAGQALAGSADLDDMTRQEIAAFCYALADAMMEARERLGDLSADDVSALQRAGS